MLIDVGSCTVFCKHKFRCIIDFFVIIQFIIQGFYQLFPSGIPRTADRRLKAHIQIKPCVINSSIFRPFSAVHRVGRVIDRRLNNISGLILFLRQFSHFLIKCNQSFGIHIKIFAELSKFFRCFHFVVHAPHNDGRMIISLSDHFFQLLGYRTLI